MRHHRKGLLAVVVTLAVSTAAMPVAAGTANRSFSVVQLPGPGRGEPSIAADRAGDVYVGGPIGLLGGPVGLLTGTQQRNGVSVWTSHDGGRSFGAARSLGASTGGGDSDLATPWNSGGDDRTVYLGDLQLWSTAVCVSRDAGATWGSAGAAADPNHCSTVGQGNYGPVLDDRPWLTPDRGGRVYITYHTLVQPVTFRSDSYGADGFSAGPCGPMVTDPTIEANLYTANGSLLAKPVLDAQGNIYVLVLTATPQQGVAALEAGQAQPTDSQAYMMVSTDGCQSWKDYTIFDGSALGPNSAEVANIFGALAIDGAGTLYAVGDGFIGAPPFISAQPNNVFLFVSTDHGKTWSKPLQVDTGDTTFLPAMVGGSGAGQLAIGYYRTLGGATDPGAEGTRWTYTVAESGNADSAHPTFTFTDMNNGFVYHRGPSVRGPILDFSSATLGTGNCPLFAWAADQTSTVRDYVARQTDGCFTSAGRHAVPAPPPGAPVGAPLHARLAAAMDTTTAGAAMALPARPAAVATTLPRALPPLLPLLLTAVAGPLRTGRRRAARQRSSTR